MDAGLLASSQAPLPPSVSGLSPGHASRDVGPEPPKLQSPRPCPHGHGHSPRRAGCCNMTPSPGCLACPVSPRLLSAGPPLPQVPASVQRLSDSGTGQGGACVSLGLGRQVSSCSCRRPRGISRGGDRGPPTRPGCRPLTLLTQSGSGGPDTRRQRNPISLLPASCPEAQALGRTQPRLPSLCSAPGPGVLVNVHTHKHTCTCRHTHACTYLHTAARIYTGTQMHTIAYSHKHA